MKAIFTAKPTIQVDKVQISTGEGAFLECDFYKWLAPDGKTILVNMLLPCPKCGYPLFLNAEDLDIEPLSLRQEVRCPARWKVLKETPFGKLYEVDEKNKSITTRCSWRGAILNGKVETL